MPECLNMPRHLCQIRNPFPSSVPAGAFENLARLVEDFVDKLWINFANYAIQP